MRNNQIENEHQSGHAQEGRDVEAAQEAPKSRAAQVRAGLGTPGFATMLSVLVHVNAECSRVGPLATKKHPGAIPGAHLDTTTIMGV
jgi:hypothetical protein